MENIDLSKVTDYLTEFAIDYWGVFFDMNQKVYKTFPQKGLNIPFPQMDVHIHGNGKK